MAQEDKDKNKNGEGKNNLAENAKAIIFTVFIKALIFIAIIAIVFGLLGAAQFELRVQDAIWDEKDNEETSPDAYFESIYITENGTLMAGLSVEELWEKEDVYSDYLSSIDALAYMLNAQVVTQYPYIEGASSDELNGTIRFYRNNSSQAMKYVDIATLNEYVSSYNSGNTDVLNDALSSFYLNSDGTISIAYLTEDEYEVTTYDVRAANDAEAQIGATATSVSRRYRIYRSESYLSIKNISYSNYIQNYVLPFNLLWAFTVYTRDGGEEFAHILASMAYEGEISLIINDNENIIQDTYTYTYDIESKQEIDGARAEISIATQDSESGDTISGYHRETTDEQFNTDEEVIERFDSSIPTIYVETHTTNTPSIALKGVVSWIATYENTNTFTTSQSSSDNSSGITPPESPTEWEVVDDSEEIWYFSEKYDGCQSVDLIDWANTQSILALQIYDGIATATLNEVTLVADVTTYERFVDIEVSYNETITRTQFSGGTSSVVFNQNLARILNVGEFSNVKKNVTDSYRNTDGYFRRIIRGNANTANLEDLIAYWFNEATGTNDFGDLDFDSIFDSNDDSYEIASSSLLELARELTNTYEGCTTVSSDGTQYRIEDDGYGNLAVGHGIDIYNGGFASEFRARGYSIVEGEWVDAEFVEQLELQKIQEAYDAIILETSSLDLTDYQIIALISRYYNAGSSGWKTSRNGKTFVEAYVAYWSSEKDNQYYGNSSDTSIYSEQMYTTYMYKPNTSRRTIF